MSNVISKENIDFAVKELTKSYGQEYKAIVDTMTKILEERINAICPDVIKECREKYPSVIVTAGSYRITAANGDSFHLYPNSPRCFDSYSDILTDSDKEALRILVEKLSANKTEATKMKGAIRHTLTDLRTIPAVKANFPEAYAVLQERIEGIKADEPKISLSELRKTLNKSE